MSDESHLDPQRVAARLRQAAKLFRFRDAAGAREAMEGRLPGDGQIGGAHVDFAEAVGRRLRLLTQLNRRRGVLQAATGRVQRVADSGRG